MFALHHHSSVTGAVLSQQSKIKTADQTVPHKYNDFTTFYYKAYLNWKGVRECPGDVHAEKEYNKRKFPFVNFPYTTGRGVDRSGCSYKYYQLSYFRRQWQLHLFGFCLDVWQKKRWLYRSRSARWVSRLEAAPKPTAAFMAPFRSIIW